MILHTMIRVRDLEQSIDFYTRILGMHLLRRRDLPEQKYSVAFVGFNQGNTQGQAEIELTFNHGVDHYEIGNAFGHIAISVPDAYSACERITMAGGKVTRHAGPMQGGTTVIAFITDPNGYKIELIQKLKE